MHQYAQHESKVRGTFDFPLEYHCVDRLHPRYEMPFHWHMECEFVQVLQGRLRLLLDGAVLDLRPGLSAFLPGGVIHGGFPQGRESVYECVVADLEHFFQGSAAGCGQFRSILDGGSRIQSRFSCDSDAGRCIQDLFREVRRRETGYECRITGLLWGFVGSVLRSGHYAPTRREHGRSALRVQQIKGALRRIQQDFSQPLTLSDLSREAAMTPKYFCRVFRQMTGRTPIDYLNRCRVERAAELLCVRGGSITETALSCGFNDPGYFSRIFKKYKHAAPTQYRRQAAEIIAAPP